MSGVPEPRGWLNPPDELRPRKCSECRGDAYPDEFEDVADWKDAESVLCEECRPEPCVYCESIATGERNGDPACARHADPKPCAQRIEDARERYLSDPEMES